MPTSAADPNLIAVDNPILGMIDAEAARQGVDRNLAHTVAQMESGYDPRAVSPKGAMGVFQLMPDTAQDMGVADPMNPAQNIRGGISYLKKLGGKYGPDDTVRILAGYNAGPGNVDKYGGVPPFPETANYVEKGTRLLASASPSDLSTDPNLTPVPAASSPGDLTPVAPAPSSQRSVEILPPLTEPPGGKPAPPEKTFKGFLDNATMGLGRILEPLTDPAGTLENVTNLLQGMSEKSGFAPVMGQPKQQVIDGIVNLYKHRYGSLEGFKNAFYDDPVGIAADVATVFSGAGLGVDAAQDFLKASGIAQHAASIADILPEVKAAATAGTAETRIQAGVRGAVDLIGKRYKEVVQAGFEKAPTGVLGGPHGMLGAAKYGAAKKAAEILKEGWQAGTKAFDASVAAPAAEAGAAAPTVTPVGPGSPIITPPPEAAPAAAAAAPAPLTSSDLARSLYGNRPLTDVEAANVQNLYSQVGAGQPPVAPSSPRVMSPAEAAQVFPDVGVTPGSPGEPSAISLRPGDHVQWTSQGIDQFQEPRQIRGFSSDGKYAFVEGTNTGFPVEQLTLKAPPDVAPSTVVAAPAAEPPAAPPAAPVAPEAPPAAGSEKLDDLAMFRQMRAENPTQFGDYSVVSTTGGQGTRFWVSKDTGETVGPFATEAEGVSKAKELAGVPAKPAAATGLPLDPVAFVSEQLKAGNQITPGMLQRQFGMKYSAARKLLKDLAPPTTSAEGAAAFEQAKTSGQPAVTLTPEPPSDLEQQLAQSIREAQAGKTAAAPVVQPGQTVAQALAAQAPPGPKSLDEFMAGIPQSPGPKRVDIAQATRVNNVEHVYDFMQTHGITLESVEAEGNAGWRKLARKAGIGPKNKPDYVPSETTKALLRQRFAASK